MTKKDIRDMSEMKNLFADPKFRREAWKAVGNAILQNPCTHPVSSFDKNGMETADSIVEKYSYAKLKEDIVAITGENREPTELEMILQSQMVRARTDVGAATFVRDTLGAKPVDETKLDATVSNPYESLTDEELEMLQKARDDRAKQQS